MAELSGLDFQTLSQPYLSGEAEIRDLLFPARTTAQLVDEADSINTRNKYPGRRVWDITLGRPVYADAAGVNDTWSLSTGVVSTTPAP